MSQLPQYAIHFYSRKQCPYLIKGSLYQEGQEYKIDYYTDEYLPLREALNEKEEAALDNFKLLLRVLRLLAESCRELENWLIEEQLLSFHLDDIYLDCTRSIVCFKLAEGHLNFRQGLMMLLEEIQAVFPQSNADVIANRLLDEDRKKLLSKRSVIRILGNWEMDLKSER